MEMIFFRILTVRLGSSDRQKVLDSLIPVGLTKLSTEIGRILEPQTMTLPRVEQDFKPRNILNFKSLFGFIKFQNY